MLWRRLDTAGHDACRLVRHRSGCEITGTAVFLHNGAPAQLAYWLICDEAWSTRQGGVKGFIGTRDVDIVVERANGAWTMNGAGAPGLEECVHLDFAFTPATNVPHLQQLALAVGQSADLPVAWLQVPPSPLVILPQRYERRGEYAYWYDAPTVGYAGLLEVTSEGFIRRYPALWEAES